MKKELLYLALFLGFISPNYAQEGGVVSFDVPAKSSLKFNKFLINPAFSFVREDESFISILNKRQYSGFDNSPQAYFASYSGRFRDDNGIAFGAFQRNYGVLTTFGVVGNFARSIELSYESRFTFGLNLAYVNSGLGSKVITGESDPILNAVPKNSLISLNPGINYSTGLMDFGISANNIFVYNFAGSNVLSGDPAQSFGGHIMYTGYMTNSGFLENGKFTGLLKAEAAKGQTNFSALALINVPKAGWIQAGYNNINGISAGLGLIVAKKLSIGYALEKGMGAFSNFGISHEITLAYKLKGYGDFEDYKPIVKATNKTNPGGGSKAVAVKKKSPAELLKERNAQLALKAEQDKARLEADRLKRLKDIADAKEKADALAALKKLEAEKLVALQGKDKALSDAEKANRDKDAANARANAANAAKLKAEQDKADALADAARLRQEKADAAKNAIADAAARAKATKEETARLAKEKADAIATAAAKAKADAEAKAIENAAANSQAAADKLKAEQANLAIEAERIRKEKVESERLARQKAAADAKALTEANAKSKEAADKLKADQAAAKAESDRIAKEKADAASKALAEANAKAKETADKLKADQAAAKAESDRIAKEKADAASKALAEANAKAKETADKLKADQAAAKAESDRIAKEKADAASKALSEANAKSKEAADKLKAEQAAAKAESDRIAKEKAAADAKALTEANAKAKETADKLKADQAAAKAESDRIAKEKADAALKVKADAIAKAKEDADKLKADQAAAKAESDRIAKEKIAADAKAKLDAEKAKADAANAKAAEEKAAKDKLAADIKAKADAEKERLAQEAADKLRIDAAKSAEDKELDNLSQVLEDSKKNQKQSLSRLDSIAKAKDDELKDLRRINDLSDKGIVTPAKEFQSTTAANAALESLKREIAQSAQSQNTFISEFETRTKERLAKVPNKNDIVNINYAKELEKLKADKLASDRKSAELLAKLESIKAETAIEKKRTIKRANFDSDDNKYAKDRERLKQIKLQTTPTGIAYKDTDFDFGEQLVGTQIIKNVNNVESGFYLVVATHKDEAKRDAFVTKAIEAGQKNIDYFYNANNGTYYIYYQVTTDIIDATKANEAKGTKAYNGKMTIVKVEK